MNCTLQRRSTSSIARVPLLAGGRSSLWVPLLDGARVTCILHVESSTPGYYGEQHQSLLQNVAAETIPAIHRVLLREQMTRAGAPVDMVGMSAGFLEVERQIRVAALSRAPALITGERGSGKELTAWAIHGWSDRRDRPFVPVVASAFAESLFADELFGHERHAFTDAAHERPGKFQAAEGGTLFLDEVADMSLTVQAALLRAVERGEVPRIGRDLPLRVDVRIITATNRDLQALIAQGRFREDLYDRLSTFEIRVPPLRERPEDIPLLAGHFLQKYCQQMRRDFMLEGAGICAACQQAEEVSCATAAFYHALQAYEWPGNVRELEKIIIRLVANTPHEILDVKHLPEPIWKGPARAAKPAVEGMTLEAGIKSRIEQVLQLTGYNQSQAARILGIPLTTLRDKIKKLGIEMKKR